MKIVQLIIDLIRAVVEHICLTIADIVASVTLIWAIFIAIPILLLPVVILLYLRKRRKEREYDPFDESTY